MNAREFCYWLQGAFEISDLKEMTVKQVSMVKAHLALVDKCDPKNDNTFVAYARLRMHGINALDNAGTSEIRRLLGAQFKHEIDPSYAGDKPHLQQIHDGDSVTYRC